jgi:hypothetical protein
MGAFRRFACLVQYLLAVLKGRETSVFAERYVAAVKKDLLATVLDNETIAFGEVEPLDSTVQSATILGLTGTCCTDFWNGDLQAAFVHLPLHFNGKDELLATFLAGDECVSIGAHDSVKSSGLSMGPPAL